MFVVAQPFRALPTPDELIAWKFCCTGLLAADIGRLLPFRFGLVRAGGDRCNELKVSENTNHTCSVSTEGEADCSMHQWTGGSFHRCTHHASLCYRSGGTIRRTTSEVNV